MKDTINATKEIQGMRSQKDYEPPFDILSFRVTVGNSTGNKGVLPPKTPEAVVEIQIKQERFLIVDEGDGPVNALDRAIRKALLPSYPFLERVNLLDYNVHIIDGKRGTGSEILVSILFSDGSNTWESQGHSTDIVEASFTALLIGLEYGIIKHNSH
jgi:2-isopropylmalate synthase